MLIVESVKSTIGIKGADNRGFNELYGVTEFESINILFEHNVNDYVSRYYRMKNRIPNYVD